MNDTKHTEKLKLADNIAVTVQFLMPPDSVKPYTSPEHPDWGPSYPIAVLHEGVEKTFWAKERQYQVLLSANVELNTVYCMVSERGPGEKFTTFRVQMVPKVAEPKKQDSSNEMQSLFGPTDKPTNQSREIQLGMCFKLAHDTMIKHYTTITEEGARPFLYEETGQLFKVYTDLLKDESL